MIFHRFQNLKPLLVDTFHGLRMSVWLHFFKSCCHLHRMAWKDILWHHDIHLSHCASVATCMYQFRQFHSRILWSYIVDVFQTRSKVHLFAVAPVLGNMAFSWQQFLRLTLQALLPALLVNASWLEALCRSLKLPATLLPSCPRCTSQVWTRSSTPLGLESNMSFKVASS